MIAPFRTAAWTGYGLWLTGNTFTRSSLYTPTFDYVNRMVKRPPTVLKTGDLAISIRNEQNSSGTILVLFSPFSCYIYNVDRAVTHFILKKRARSLRNIL